MLDEKQKLDPASVRAQVRRIQESAAFRNKVQLQINLAKVTEMVLEGRPEEDFLWHQLEWVLFRKPVKPRDPKAPLTPTKENERAAARVRIELDRINKRLKAYYLTEASSSDVYEIRTVVARGPGEMPGSHKPRIVGWKGRQTSDLSVEAKRVMLRIRAALDARTFGGDLRAMSYLVRLPEPFSAELLAFFAFVLTALSARMPGMAAYWRLRLSEEEVAKIARENDCESWEIVFVEACSKAMRKRQWASALESMRLAVEMSQGDAAMYWWYPALLASRGQHQAGIRALSETLENAPTGRISTSLRCDLAMLLIFAKEYEQAEEWLLGAVDIVGVDHPVVESHLALLYEAQGETEKAAGRLLGYMTKFVNIETEVLRTGPPAGFEFYYLAFAIFGFLAGRLGAMKAAEGVWDSFKKHGAAGKSVFAASQLALAAMGVNRIDDAVAYLRKAAFDELDPLTMWFHIFPPLRHLRGDPGYEQLLQELKLSYSN